MPQTARPFTAAEWATLKRCERTLHKWAEHLCNGVIQYDDNGNNPRLYHNDRYGSPTLAGRFIPDKSETAMETARKVAARHGLSVYHQSDPRGCALYAYNPADLKGRDIRSYYSSIGKPVA